LTSAVPPAILRLRDAAPPPLLYVPLPELTLILPPASCRLLCHDSPPSVLFFLDEVIMTSLHTSLVDAVNWTLTLLKTTGI